MDSKKMFWKTEKPDQYICSSAKKKKKEWERNFITWILRKYLFLYSAQILIFHKKLISPLSYLTQSHTLLESEIPFTHGVHDSFQHFTKASGKNSALNEASHHFKIFTPGVPGKDPRITSQCTHISFFLWRCHFPWNSNYYYFRFLKGTWFKRIFSLDL